MERLAPLVFTLPGLDMKTGVVALTGLTTLSTFAENGRKAS